MVGAPHVTAHKVEIEYCTQCRWLLRAVAGLELPVVAKPDLGCRGVVVKLVRTRADLAAYFGIIGALIGVPIAAAVYGIMKYVRGPEVEPSA